MKPLKYRNVPTVLDGRKFSSGLEASRYAELLLLQRAGEIRGLQLQVPLVLLPPVRFHDSQRQTPAVRYVADFVYEERQRGEWLEVIEDAKGMQTKEFKLKRHMLKALLHKDVRLTRAR